MRTDKTADCQEFIGRITKKMEAVAAAPLVHKRRKKTLPQGLTPRRSRRIAGVGVEATPPLASHQRRTVMRALGIAKGQERISQQALDDYVRVFNQPLSAAHIRVLTSLFGWAPEDVPTVVVEELSSS